MSTAQIQDVSIKKLVFHNDKRGWLTELFRHDEIPEDVKPVMCYVSETKPGESRGPHEHSYQSDLFCFFGPGDMTLYLWDARKNSPTYGAKLKILVGESNPCTVIVPPGVVHGYVNYSDRKALVFNAPNKLFAGEKRACSVDEIRHEINPDTKYKFD